MKKIILRLTFIFFTGTFINVAAMNQNDSSSSSTSSEEQDLQKTELTTEKLSPLLENIAAENKNNMRQCLNAIIKLDKEITRLLKNERPQEKIYMKIKSTISLLRQTTDVFLNIAMNDSFFDPHREQLNKLAEKTLELKNIKENEDNCSIANQISTIGTITNELLNNPNVKQHLVTKVKWSRIEKTLTICYFSCLICLLGICGYELPKIVNAFALEAAADWAREGTKLFNGTTEWIGKTIDFLAYIKKITE